MTSENNGPVLVAQLNIFFALLSSIALKYSEDKQRSASNMDVLLTIITVLPILFAFVTDFVGDFVADYVAESPLVVQGLALYERLRPGLISSIVRSRKALAEMKMIWLPLAEDTPPDLVVEDNTADKHRGPKNVRKSERDHLSRRSERDMPESAAV